jgi:hypothetical protein
MTRSLGAPLAGQYTAQNLNPIALIEMFFDSGTLRFWTGIGTLTYGGNPYTGTGNVLKITEYNETQSLQARGITFILAGIESSIISLALSEPYQGRIGKLYVSALDDAGAIVGTPYQLFYGFMDSMKITERGESCDISVSLENRLVILKRKKERRFTPEDQKSRFPGDKGLDFVPTLQDREVVWKSK